MLNKNIYLSLIFLFSFANAADETIAETNTPLMDYELEIAEIYGEKEPVPVCSNPQEVTIRNTKPKRKYRIPPTLELKGGYFFFGESKMRKVYDRVGVDLQICGSYPMWKWFQIYGGIEYMRREGRSLHGNQKTKIWELPVSLGIKTVARIRENVQYYMTIGPRYFFVFNHNSSPFMDKHISQNGCGGFIGTGFNFEPVPHFLIDVFGEYSYCRLHFHPHKNNTFGESAQVGGYTFGLGIGYAF